MLRPTFPLRTERLLLRPFRDDDLDALYAMQSREDVTRYLLGPAIAGRGPAHARAADADDGDRR